MKYRSKTKYGIFLLFAAAAATLFHPVNGSARLQEAPSVPTSPAEIYAEHCAKCHGTDGRARTAKGKRSGATDFTSDWNRDESRGIRIVTNGKGEMPGFKGKLSAQEIRGVFEHVLKFKP